MASSSAPSAAAAPAAAAAGPTSAFESPTFQEDVSIYVEGGDVGAASISPSGRDVVLASKLGLNIIDLDNPYSPPRFISNRSSWDVADVQWSPFASRPEWIASTCNQLALVYNLAMAHNVNKAPIQYTLRTHERAITDINFAAHHPDFLATCGVDSFVFVHDLRAERPALKLADFVAGATQVKWNRQDSNIIASSHDKYLHIWDLRRGAQPLSTIEAHSTKIYGIDWNRSEPTKIMTCSLDYTIKLWDNVGVKNRITTPSRIIRTHYPVWRARHTPFPGGILAMPQRGNSSLWLYNNSKDCNINTTGVENAAHDFKGHDANQHVREFLWRTRGSTDDGFDNREFQLVSWGTDKRLHLHQINPELLATTVGFHKGEPVVGEPSTTRRGAAYLTYRDGPVTPTATGREELDAPRAQRKGNLSTLLQKSSLNDEFFANYRNDAQPRAQMEPLPRATMTATPIRRSAPRVVGHITWMEGVKFAERQRDGQEDGSKPDGEERDEKYRNQSGHDLATEIAYVGNKYRKLNFEVVDIPGRRVTVSFNGPWGDYDVETSQLKLVFLRLTIKFPPGYPKAMENNHSSIGLPRIPTPLDIEFERTTATVGKSLMATLTEDIEHIARVYAHQEREALEAVLSFALGERGFQDSLKLTEDDQPTEEGPLLEGESSSEDDDNEGEFNDEAMQSSHTNANIPRPVQTSARFSVNGSLVLSRILVTRSAPLSSAQFRLPRFLRNGPSKDDIFETFGRFGKRDDSEGGSSPSSSIGSWEMSTSPSSGSESDQGANGRIGNFQPPLAWQKATTRFQTRSSIPSSIGAAKPIKDRSILSVLSSAIEDLVPAKRVLAEEYLIFGRGPEVCLHNSEVARRHGFEDLADIWLLCKLILSNEVPLEILPQQLRREQVLVLARRALVRIKRKDSGLDLQFDAADAVTNPKLKGRIKWGHHAVVTWLIPALFDHFERLADVQMLAMLSCIFSEPAAREGVPSAMAKMRQSHLPMSMEAPAFSLDYFSSSEAAWSLFKPTISVPSTPAHSRYATPQNEFGWHRLTKTLDTYGSHGSSNGPWGSDTIPSEPVTPYSTGNTPPILSRTPTVRSVATASHTPYSTSPEQSQAGKRLTGTNFASAVAALSRPFANAMSSSPPVKSRVDDLSTSAPTGVTWGTTTFYGSGSQERSLVSSRIKHGKRASFGQSDRINVDYISDSESEYDAGTALDGASEYATTLLDRDSEEDDGGMIRVTLKNQDQFDDEACVSAPLLDMSKDWLFRSWREQYAELLGCWDLVSERAEVLKFNGLISYFPQEGSRGASKAGSMVLAPRKDDEGNSGQVSRALSRASTLAPPPSVAHSTVKRSPAASPRHFSFNPEALEFTPGNSFSPAEELAPPPDVFISNEQYLRLSIPSPTNEDPENLPPVSAIGEVINEDKLHPLPNRSLRPSLSRAASQVSNSSIGRSSTGRKDKKDPIYSCSICWIRVSGRFYLCPGCGHVAHFDCMDDELGMDEGECIVGCGCGCGLEEEDERSRMEAYIDEVRAWEESGGWMSETNRTDDLLTLSAYEGVYGEEAGGWVGVEAPQKTTEKRGGEKTKKEKSKPRRKARVSGKSYY